jgi:hypothetical protein
MIPSSDRAGVARNCFRKLASLRAIGAAFHTPPALPPGRLCPGDFGLEQAFAGRHPEVRGRRILQAAWRAFQRFAIGDCVHIVSFNEDSFIPCVVELGKADGGRAVRKRNPSFSVGARILSSRTGVWHGASTYRGRPTERREAAITRSPNGQAVPHVSFLRSSLQVLNRFSITAADTLWQLWLFWPHPASQKNVSAKLSIRGEASRRPSAFMPGP